MENASKALIIAGAILLSILIIAIGMFIYTSSQSTITDSMTQMSTQEIEAFNSQFTVYGGKKTGAQLKSMMGTLIANANTYREDAAKMPGIKVTQFSESKNQGNNTNGHPTGGDVNSYINVLADIRNKLENKHSYQVDFDYSGNGVLTFITVTY